MLGWLYSNGSNMRIWHISDTHGYHKWFEIPQNIDIVVHSGDATNSRNPVKNAKKMREFLEWFYRRRHLR